MGRKGGYETLPLTFHILEGNGGYVDKASNNPPALNLEMRVNGGAWQSFVQTYVNSGDIIEFRGDNYPSAAGKWTGLYCTSGVVFEIYGNIMSIPFGNNFADKVAITQDYAFNSFFNPNIQGENEGLVSAKNLILPALALAESCYSNMFRDKAALVEAPALPATTLAANCYENMFNGCTSLIEAPELPATTLAASCYYSMFVNCTSLTETPALPATTLAQTCYGNMFYGCTSLKYAPSTLPATTLAQYCYMGMFGGCSSLIEAPELPATTLAAYCYQSMFTNCSSLILAPELPAPTLVTYCYYYMFSGCSQLAQIICPATSISASSSHNNWLSGVAAQGTFYKAAGVSWPSGASGIPSGWSVIEV